MVGEIRREDFESLLMELFEDPDFRPNPRLLIDQREGRLVATGSDVRTQTQFLKSTQDRMGVPRVAIVVGTMLDVGLNRMFENMSEGSVAYAGKIFRNVKEARAWLEEDGVE